MTTQLYDLFLHQKAAPEAKPAFVMRAPLSTIEIYLQLHRDACNRIVRETEAGGVCQVFARRWPDQFHVVTLAIGVR